VHFELRVISDVLRAKKGEPLAYLQIPGSKTANLNLAVNELQQLVADIGRSKQLNLPPVFANNVQVAQVYPDPAAMQSMLNRPGNYVMAAFAATDIYPHVGGLPIVITLEPAK
jgi:hypothetical protein